MMSLSSREFSQTANAHKTWYLVIDRHFDPVEIRLVTVGVKGDGDHQQVDGKVGDKGKGVGSILGS